MSRMVVFLLEDIPAEYIEKMRASGLYGDGETEIVKNLVMAGIRQAITDTIIELRDHGPEAPRGELKVYACTHCRDGAEDSPEDMLSDGTCPKCGTLCEIIF